MTHKRGDGPQTKKPQKLIESEMGDNDQIELEEIPRNYSVNNEFDMNDTRVGNNIGHKSPYETIDTNVFAPLAIEQKDLRTETISNVQHQSVLHGTAWASFEIVKTDLTLDQKIFESERSEGQICRQRIFFFIFLNFFFFPTVWKGTWRSTVVTIKMIKDESDFKNFQSEMSIVTKLRPHTNIGNWMGKKNILLFLNSIFNFYNSKISSIFGNLC